MSAARVVSGRQVRAGRVLAGLSQSTFAAECGVGERSVRRWEGKVDELPSVVGPTRLAIHAALLRHGVELVSDPVPGALFRGVAK